MGVFDSIKNSWTKAGAASVLRRPLVVTHNIGLITDNPDRLSQGLVDDLYSLCPEWLDKSIHPKPPMHELIAIGALMLPLRDENIDNDTSNGLTYSYFVLLRDVINDNSPSQLTMLEAMLLDAAFEFIWELMNATKALPDELETKLIMLHEEYITYWNI